MGHRVAMTKDQTGYRHSSRYVLHRGRRHKSQIHAIDISVVLELDN